MSVGVVDLAHLVSKRLEALGFKIDYGDDCESIFEALEQVDFIKIEDMKILVNRMKDINNTLIKLRCP